uniref:Mucoidy inhibitor MuiA family protein n=1 Tax=Panagrellus redivivus TaxID=6233 RepID=A0A7E4VHJ5_PANRE
MSLQIAHFNSRDIPIKSVTVYTDRAEISRIFTVPIKSGFTEVRIDNLAGAINRDSVRVDGTGLNATIHEVRFETKPVKPEDLDSPRIRELVAQQKELQVTIDDARSLKNIYEAQIEALNKALGTLGQNAVGNKDGNFLAFNNDSVESLHNFFNFQQQQTIDLKAKIRIQTEIIDEKTREVERIQNEINQLRSNFRENNIVTVQLENTGDEDTNVEVELSYHVFNANWAPSYDIRVKSAENNHTLKLVYYGNIRQHTGEDWTDVDIVLSTATPGLGEVLPTLGTTNVQFFEPQVIQPMMFRHNKAAVFGSADVASAAGNAAPRMQRKQMEVQQDSTISTTFIIPIKKTIPSDDSEHKVIITTEQLDALLSYHVVPKKNTNVFLFANVINNSNYPLLAGAAVVYVNNSMVATNNINAVFPGEKFKCSLGVDKAVKVTYKPTNNYQTQSGILSKTNSTSNEQRIIVKNTKLNEAVLLTVHEPIPKATDEQIKVKLLSPEVKEATNNEEDKASLKAAKVGAVLDDLHNLEWTSLIAANKESELLVKWAVEYPPNKKLQYVETNER